jgi:hypothetical protein
MLRKPLLIYKNDKKVFQDDYEVRILLFLISYAALEGRYMILEATHDVTHKDMVHNTCCDMHDHASLSSNVMRCIVCCFLIRCGT